MRGVARWGGGRQDDVHALLSACFHLAILHSNITCINILCNTFTFICVFFNFRRMRSAHYKKPLTHGHQPWGQRGHGLSVQPDMLSAPTPIIDKIGTMPPLSPQSHWLSSALLASCSNALDEVSSFIIKRHMHIQAFHRIPGRPGIL